MPWLLDGNNLARGGSRERVRRAALELVRAQRVKVVVVFDGAPPPGSAQVERLGQVEVHYAPNADAALLELLAGGGPGWRVATDDRELARRARESGADVVAGEVFWARAEGRPRLTGAATQPAPQWQRELEYFRDQRNRLDGGPQRVARRRRAR